MHYKVNTYLFVLFLKYLYPCHNPVDQEAHYANQTMKVMQIKLQN